MTGIIKGLMAEWIECWYLYPEVAGSNPTQFFILKLYLEKKKIKPPGNMSQYG